MKPIIKKKIKLAIIGVLAVMLDIWLEYNYNEEEQGEKDFKYKKPEYSFSSNNLSPFRFPSTSDDNDDSFNLFNDVEPEGI